MSGDYLTKLRQKPKHVRDNIAFGVASGFTALIALFLVFAVHGPKVVENVASEEDNSPRFFETITSQVKEQVAASRSSIESQSNDPEPTSGTPPPAANGSGAPAPAILTASSSVLVVSTTTRTVLIATTSAQADAAR